jgi:plastocyanin
VLAGLTAASFALSGLPAAADDVKAIAIVKNADGKFVFTDADAKIKQGQSVKWVAVDSGVTHQLVRGTITVAAAAAPAEEAKPAPKAEPKAQAEEPAEEAPAPKKTKKAKPSSGGYGY